MHDRLRLKKDGDQTVAAAEASGVVSKNWMDLKREELQAYEYLCHLGEAKEWVLCYIETLFLCHLIDCFSQGGWNA